MIGFVFFVGGEKKILVCDDNRELKAQYNLTALGLEHEVDNYEDFKRFFGEPYYNYNMGDKLCDHHAQ